MSWITDVEGVSKGMIALVFGFGIALFVGVTFATAMPAGAAANAINLILTSVETNLTTFIGPIIAIIFALVIYGIYQDKFKNQGGRKHR